MFLLGQACLMHKNWSWDVVGRHLCFANATAWQNLHGVCDGIEAKSRLSDTACSYARCSMTGR